jgi:ADP-heptose:LPS heptosyltransferase
MAMDVAVPTRVRKRPPLKRLEAVWKRAWMRLFARLLRGNARVQPPDWDARPYRVLYLRYDRIGDMIMATSLIRAIKQSHDTITVDVLASRSNAPVLLNNPRVLSVTTFDRKSGWSYIKTMLRLSRAGYDAIIDGMVLKPSMTMLLLMLSSRARYRIGIGGRENDFIYSLPVSAPPPDEHHITHSAATAIPFGVDPDRTDWRPEIFLTPDERQRAERAWASDDGRQATRVLVNISAGEPRRRWPEEYFVDVVHQLSTRDVPPRVFVMAAPEDAAAAERIARAGGARAVVPRLRDAFGLVASADVVFTPDTSMSHAASAFDKPAIVMMIQGMSIFEPYQTRGRSLYSDGPTLASLPVDSVIRALDDVLRDTGGSQRHTDAAASTMRSA